MIPRFFPANALFLSFFLVSPLFLLTCVSTQANVPEVKLQRSKCVFMYATITHTHTHTHTHAALCCLKRMFLAVPGLEFCRMGENPCWSSSRRIQRRLPGSGGRLPGAGDAVRGRGHVHDDCPPAPGGASVLPGAHHQSAPAGGVGHQREAAEGGGLPATVRRRPVHCPRLQARLGRGDRQPVAGGVHVPPLAVC